MTAILSDRKISRDARALTKKLAVTYANALVHKEYIAGCLRSVQAQYDAAVLEKNEFVRGLHAELVLWVDKHAAFEREARIAHESLMSQAKHVGSAVCNTR